MVLQGLFLLKKRRGGILVWLFIFLHLSQGVKLICFCQQIHSNQHIALIIKDMKNLENVQKNIKSDTAQENMQQLLSNTETCMEE